MGGRADLEGFLNYLAVERGMSKNTVCAYRRDLDRFFRQLEKDGTTVADVTPRTVQDHLEALRGAGISERSMARALSALKSLFRYLVSVDLLTEDRVGEVRGLRLRKSIPGFLELSEITKLIESIPRTTPAGLRNRAMLELFYGAGLRVSELCDLALSQVDLVNGFVTVIGKGNKERTVPIGRMATEALDDYLKKGRPAFLNGRSTDRVFLTKRCAGWTRQGVWKWIQSLARSAGMDKSVYPHLLRHTFATHVLSGGADLRSVQELLGHANITTTEIYTHLDTPRLRQIHRQFHPRA